MSKRSDVALCLSFITKYLKNNDSKTSGTAKVTKLAVKELSYDYQPRLTDEADSIIEFLSVFQCSLTHLELIYFKFESILQLEKILKSCDMLQSLILSVTVNMITEERHLEKALQDITHLRHLELDMINIPNDDATIPDNLLEFRTLIE